jgi:hypothetical protein
MMPRLIRLKHYHTATQKVQHPSLDDAKVYSEDELQVVLQNVLSGHVEHQELTLALRSALRHMIGRYKANWPSTIPFLDDMVSEGLLALSRLSSEISFDFLAGRGILKVASQRMQDQIETYLNSNQALSAAGMWKQKQNISEGLDPLYCTSSTEKIPDTEHPTDEGDEWKRDILDTINSIKVSDDIGVAILAKENWGRSYQELADDLGVGVGTIHRRKAQLYSKFLELTR